MKNKKSNINIKNVMGDVVISQDQKGGSTFSGNKRAKPIKKEISKIKLSVIIVTIASTLSILTYFGIQPGNKSPVKEKPATISATESSDSIDSNNTKSEEATTNKTESKNQSISGEENKMTEHKDKVDIESDPNNPENTISTGDVEGNVVISQNQSGGQIANTINNYGPLKRTIIPDVKQKMLTDLIKYSGHKIGFASTQGDKEASKFKEILIGIFKEAGWNVQDMKTFMFFGEKDGLVVTIPFNADEEGIPQVVARALALTGNPVSGNHGDMANDCGVYVQVWHNPE